MKEMKILAVIIALVGITYYGIEPYAHHVMHPEPAAADFEYKDLTMVNIADLKGNVENGKSLVEANCLACHSIEVAGFPPMMSDQDAAASYGVVPPDLSYAGHMYNTNYLANFIYDPVKAMAIEHKYPVDGTKTFPMPASNWMQPQEIADMVAYLKSIVPNQEISTIEKHKATFEAACGRCHGMDYANIQAKTDSDTLNKYIGAKAPDLSQYIKSRGEHYLHSFINNPQHLLPGTGMPRVGLTEEAQHDVIAYMEEIGDSKKQERETLGVEVIIYMVIFSIFAILWKRKIWKDLH
jgi:ubiquinol-cytochrome c reductase cytochrome c1 subunit